MSEQQARERLRVILDDALEGVLPPDAKAAGSDAVYRALMERGSVSGMTVGHGQQMVAYTLVLEDW